ncbi:enoyl-CoA hydratase-related protein [Maricaulis salignorans]|uniref:Enoyl-CoA hydratase n=1 Tax=Maricaulis salignorans TaxID=144026 RepID=A0A1G9M1N9_9PROT|nr:enoyl-CoA hydratase-related protein [Maricaulis salignorans]SDL68179.1 enoyl-CoA hydratase [Maricaulis salignorans]
MSDAFSIVQDGAIARLTLTRPERANALGSAFWRDFPLAIDALNQAGQTRVLLIESEGRHFCSGMDTDAFTSLGKSDSAHDRFQFRANLLVLQETLTKLEQANFAVIAAIQGACLGGGLDLVLACDIRVCSQNASFGIEETNIAIVADLGSLQRGVHALPYGVMCDMALTGRRMPAAEAARYGLVSSIEADDAACRARAAEIAETIASKSPLMTVGIKRSLQNARDAALADGLRFIADWNAGMFSPAEVGEALTARMEKREAVFQSMAGPDASGE